MDLATALFLLVAAGAAFIQGASGFAFALIASALWAWLIEPQVLAPTVVLTSLIGQLSSLVRLGGKARFAHAGPFLVGGVLGTPLGVMLLPLFDAASFRLAIGIVLIIYCALMLRRGGLPRITGGGRRADAGIGVMSGIMGGATGISGPPIVLWCAMRGWDKETQRATFQTFFVGILLVILGFQIAGGLVDARCLRLAAIAAVPIVVCSWLGGLAFDRLSQEGFQRLIMWLLLASGIALVYGGL
jgi:uncharacterized membrane protein YfcA